MSHQHHQRVSLRVANNNVSASVPVETTNTTNTATNAENNEENTNQMTCVMREFFFLLILRSFGTPFFGISFCTEEFLSREFNIHAR